MPAKERLAPLAALPDAPVPTADFLPFVKAVGRGAKLRRDLTEAEAALAIQLIGRGVATPAQAGAFLIAQRVKGEALDEILGFTRGARAAFVTTLAPRVDDLLDLGVPYDGKVKTAQLVPAVAVLLAACGLPVLVHGAQGVPTKAGITPGAVFAALGVPADLTPARAERRLEQAGVAYLDAAQYAPAWNALTPLRRELGLRTALNTVEKLFNPAGAPYQLSGFFHGEYLERLRQAQTGTRASWIVQGEEGSVEMAAGRATRVFAEDEAGDRVLDPAAVGLPQRERLTPPFEVAAHARLNAAAMAGEPGAASDQAAFSAGVILALVGAAADAADGLARARQAAATGAAQKQLALACRAG
jgi:anthranilate phosphoribosyltransferase